jgi:hypothetical protein
MRRIRAKVQSRTLAALVAPVLGLGAMGPVCVADDWSNAGGNAGRNGVTGELGPDAADILWNGIARSSIIAWQPVIEDGRVFLVRQTGFPPSGEPNGSPVIALNLDTGAELWFRNIQYNAGDWTTWVAGVSNGKVFASRSGNGASVSAKLYALDAVTGEVLWDSDDLIDAGAYDGVVFAENGDPIIASFRTIKRIRATDGSTAWTAQRTCSVSGNCGGAARVQAGGGAVYVVDTVAGGQAIKKFNIDTGALQYQGPVMPGFLMQNTPMVAPDGTIYVSRVQNNAAVDFFYAFADDGAAMTQKWAVPAGYSTSSEFAVGPDGSVYMMAPGSAMAGYRVLRLDAESGAVVDESLPVLADFLTPRMAVDSQGRLFFSNGAFSNGRVISFNADLTERWSVAIPNVNIGAPAIGRDGTLVIAGVGTNVRAYRTERGGCPADWNGDMVVNSTDISAFVTAWLDSVQNGNLNADFNGDMVVNSTDISAFVTAWLTAVAGGC